MKAGLSAPELTSVSTEQWEEARRILPAIQRLAAQPNRRRNDVIAEARALGCGPTHLYALLGRYLADPRLTSLLPRMPGRPRGFWLCSEQINALINDAIESVYLTRQKARVSDVEAELRRRCHALGLTPPSRKAIVRRLNDKPRREIVARREGPKAARDRLGPVIGSLEADWPLALVQIDHTLVDVIVVDSCAFRPWRTVDPGMTDSLGAKRRKLGG